MGATHRANPRHTSVMTLPNPFGLTRHRVGLSSFFFSTWAQASAFQVKITSLWETTGESKLKIITSWTMQLLQNAALQCNHRQKCNYWVHRNSGSFGTISAGCLQSRRYPALSGLGGSAYSVNSARPHAARTPLHMLKSNHSTATSNRGYPTINHAAHMTDMCLSFAR